MEFRTKVEMPEKIDKIKHSDKIMLLGSCFVENIGNKLFESKIRCDLNPFGILYNPFSISIALKQILDNKKYSSDDLFFSNELWNSWLHHSAFSDSDCNKCLDNINSRIENAVENIKTCQYLVITWGSAYVYYLKDTSTVVGNCHKQKATLFDRRLISVNEIVDDYNKLISRIKSVNSQIKIIFTVSPIRHAKDGMHGNQISKSTLLLAANTLCQQHKECFYFPAYEIMMDELRDYRFYADDMIHPSSMAVEYIWECFSETCFTKETKDIIKEWSAIRKALEHRPFNPKTDAYRSFLSQNVLKIKRLKEKFPYFDLEKEIKQCQAQLKLSENK